MRELEDNVEEKEELREDLLSTVKVIQSTKDEMDFFGSVFVQSCIPRS